jgi:hypothetical protein
MKPKQLTQLEIATLAATLPTGNASERVAFALEIWKEAAARTPGTPEHSARFLSPEEFIVRLDWLLEEMMPQKRKAQREEQWERFVTWKMEHARDSGIIYGTQRKAAIFPGDKITPKEARELAEGEISRHRVEGVKEFLAAELEFRKWEEKEAKKTAKTKAKAAANARWKKIDEKKAQPKPLTTKGKAGRKTDKK